MSNKTPKMLRPNKTNHTTEKPIIDSKYAPNIMLVAVARNRKGNL